MGENPFEECTLLICTFLFIYREDSSITSGDKSAEEGNPDADKKPSEWKQLTFELIKCIGSASCATTAGELGFLIKNNLNFLIFCNYYLLKLLK